MEEARTLMMRIGIPNDLDFLWTPSSTSKTLEFAVISLGVIDMARCVTQREGIPHLVRCTLEDIMVLMDVVTHNEDGILLWRDDGDLLL
jgi:hypothetical protein